MTPLVERLLAARIGLDLATVGPTVIDRGIGERMARLGLADPAAYEHLLARSDQEQQALVEEIVIPESWFFRDERPFRMLSERAAAGWVGHLDRPPLRVLSLPCAHGEEPYSIAITLLDAGLGPSRFSVDAVDISQRCLDRAQAGIYGSNAFRGGTIPSGSDHFRTETVGIAVAPRVRQSVRFHLGNILDPLLLADQRPFDVVFCRNLLIYFDGPARTRACAGLARLLSDDGVLFLGHADRATDLDGFAPVGDRGAFAYERTGSIPPPAAPVAAPRTPPRPRPMPPTVPPKPTASAPAIPPPPAPPTRPSQPAGADPGVSPLDRASTLADQGRYDEATAVCERVIRQGGPTARACFLLGMIRQAAGDRPGAEAQFHKVIYLDAQHDEALLALAILARRRGDLAGEATYRRRAERARARKGTTS